MSDENQTETQEKSYSASEVEEMIGGLKRKVDELLGEKKAESEKRKVAETEKQEAAIEAARKTGELETLEKTLTDKYSQQVEGYKTQLDSLNAEILGGQKKTLLAELSNDFTDPTLAKALLNGMVDVARSETGVVTTFKGLNDDFASTDADEFKKYLQSNTSMQQILKGVDSSGGGAKGGASNSSHVSVPKGDMTKMTAAQKVAYLDSKKV